MKQLLKVTLTAFLLTLATQSALLGQAKDSCWNVTIVKKGSAEIIPQKKSLLYNANGFHLYRNALYSFTLQNGNKITGLLTDVLKDSIVISNYLNPQVAEKNYDTFKILTLHYNQFSKLNIVADRALAMANNINLEKHNFIFTKDTIAYRVDTIKCPYYVSDTINNCASCMDCFYSIGNNWLDLIYEEAGDTYYYMGATELDTSTDNDDIIAKDTVWRTRNAIWFAPTRYNTTINGWALCFAAMPNYLEKKLVINGLNTELGMGLILMPHVLFGFPDQTAEEYQRKKKDKENTNINGLSLSLLGHGGNTSVNGISLNGISSILYDCNGVVASFGGNFIGSFNGLMIAGIRNNAAVGKGLQISLFNSCSKLKGFQIGLINKNQKRTLPFINWCFTD
jgi:hypothetical protein